VTSRHQHIFLAGDDGRDDIKRQDTIMRITDGLLRDHHGRIATWATLAVLCALTGCSPRGHVRVQGYVEGEFVYVSSQLSGPLQTLSVQRGSQVHAEEPLFALDSTVEKAALDQAQASLTFSEQDLARQHNLSLTPGSASIRDLQLARSARDQDRQRVDQAQWNFAQKHQAAPEAALVFDTLYREGEWVEAGHPVVQLLPPQNIEVRAFIPESQIGTVHPGDKAQVFVDGVSTPFVGQLVYIFPQAEYTPPVIYSQESREKLVFMVEVTFDPATSAKLHPGQPVDVEFSP
jgi:HlyD family secretion protein